MTIDYFENGGVDAIIEHLSKSEKGTDTAILHLQCGDGQIADALKNAGFAKYHGIDSSNDNIAAAKKRIKGYSRRFHVGQLFDADNFKKKHDVVLCLHGTPYEQTPSGTKMIVATSGVGNYEQTSTIVNRILDDAKTVQHENVFITYGVRK